jgi:hypothetical protein
MGQRRERLGKVGSIWPVADDVNLGWSISTVCPANGRSPQAVTPPRLMFFPAAAIARLPP